MFSVLATVALLLSAADSERVMARDAGWHPPADLKVAVMALEAGLNIDPKLAQVVTDEFVSALESRHGLHVISSRELQTLLGFERQKQLLGCKDEACIAELSGALGVDVLVTGALARVGPVLVFTAQSVDVEHATVEHRHDGRGKQVQDDWFLDDARRAARDLFPDAPPPRVADGGTLSPAPGATRVEARTRLSFIWQPGGAFQMGCAQGDAMCEPYEAVHPMTVKGFWLAKVETSLLVYQQCTAAKACRGLAGREKRQPQCVDPQTDGSMPLNCVTWDEAKELCEWLGGRLPSAAEWEYAAKGGQNRIFPWGNEPVTGARTNFCDVNCSKVLPPSAVAEPGHVDINQDDGYDAAAPIGRFPKGASRYGVLDLAGNLREWTLTPASGDRKQTRGGSYSSRAKQLRNSSWVVAPAEGWSPDLGFRCALDP